MIPILSAASWTVAMKQSSCPSKPTAVLMRCHLMFWIACPWRMFRLFCCDQDTVKSQWLGHGREMLSHSWGPVPACLGMSTQSVEMPFIWCICVWFMSEFSGVCLDMMVKLCRHIHPVFWWGEVVFVVRCIVFSFCCRVSFGSVVGVAEIYW